MTIKCQHCKERIAEDPQRDLEEGLLDTFVTHVVHPDDSIAVAKKWHYCDPQCFVSHFASKEEP